MRPAAAMAQDAAGSEVHDSIEQSEEQSHLYLECHYHLFGVICQLIFMQWYQGISSVDERLTLVPALDVHLDTFLLILQHNLSNRFHREYRLDWCRSRSIRAESDCRNVIFGDEFHFSLNAGVYCTCFETDGFEDETCTCY